MTDCITPIRFGYLPQQWMIDFQYGKISPFPDFDTIAKEVQKRLHKDGHFYPPIANPPIPKIRRPAHLYRLPASHELCISLPSPEANIREGSAGFIIHLLAFLFRTRLQFADWFLDGRIPVDVTGTSALVHNALQAGNILSRAYSVWLTWAATQQRRFTNILYMYSRISTYEWDWEQFMLEYMILDACWKMAENLCRFKRVPHAERVSVLCKELSIEPKQLGIDVKAMTDLRNDLFHEVMWHKARPGSVGRRPFYIHVAMRALNKELILALLDRSAKDVKA